MNKQNQLRRICPPLLIASALVLSCLVLSPAVQAAPNSNTSYGRGALPGNTMGDFNSAFGVNALNVNSTGDDNTAIGTGALGQVTGDFNTAIGANALVSSTTGIENTALGHNAGLNVQTASNVICIGNSVLGANVDNSCYIGNIWQQPGGSQAVYVNASGKLGAQVSSGRFKDEIKPMEEASEVIYSLKPVSFRYKPEIEPARPLGFGLIAEDVEKVNPDLIVRDKKGNPYSVRYDQVNAMLLNEFLKEHKKVEKQEATITRLTNDFQTVSTQQRNEIQLLSAQLKEQAAQIQKVTAQLEASNPAPQVVNNP